jgi:hypothetical protein
VQDLTAGLRPDLRGRLYSGGLAPDGNSGSAATMPTTRSAGWMTGRGSFVSPVSCASLPNGTRSTVPIRTPLCWASVNDASTSCGKHSGCLGSVIARCVA